MIGPRFVSVVMTFLDAERFIEEAIESVFEQLHQEWELILVDDGSEDRSSEIARRYQRRHPDRVTYLEHPGHANVGKSASRNAGIAAAKGPMVMFFDSDDVLLSHALRTLSGALHRASGAAVVYGRARTWYSWEGNPDGYEASWDFDSRLPGPEGTVFPTGALLPTLVREDDVLPSVCSALTRMDALAAVGGWEAQFEDVYDDFALWTKLFSRFPVLVVDETLSLYRKHAESSCEEAARSGEWSPVDLSISRYRYLAWMELWLTRNRLGGEEAWRELDAALEPYRYPAAPVVVDRVRDADTAAGRIKGRLEYPVPGRRVNSHRVPIQGWVAGLAQRARAVEISAGRHMVRHIPIETSRPDVAATLGRGEDDRHGFDTTVAVAGTAPIAIEVTAILEDQTRTPLASVSAHRALRHEDRLAGSSRVSVVIVCRTEVGPLAGAIESALAQTHWPIEVIVVDDGSSSALEDVVLAYPGVSYVRCDDEGLIRARLAGLGRSTGEFVMFLNPTQRLVPTAVPASLKRLRTRNECGFAAGMAGERPLDHAALMHDGPPAGPVLYRRLALQAMGEISEAAPGLEEAAFLYAASRQAPGIGIANTLVVPGPVGGRPPTPADRLKLLRREVAHSSEPRDRHGLAEGERTLRGSTGRLRRLRRKKPTGTALLLLYHRVAELEADPWQLGVAPDRFAEHLEVLGGSYEILPLRRVVKQIRDGELSERTLAITFDDGYLDNLEVAAPLLEQNDLPATFFLATGAFDSDQEFWWDEIERILLSAGSLPDVLDLDLDGWRFKRDLRDAANLSLASARECAGWRVGSAPPTSRHSAYADLWHALWSIDRRLREDVLVSLREWAGDPGGIRSTHRRIDRDGVARLGGSSIVQLGGHTVSHPRLSACGAEALSSEIVGCKKALEEVSGQPAVDFAYPYGGLDDYTATASTLVAEAGFESASSTWEGTANAASDRFQLPRVQVADVDGDTFASEVAARFESRR